VKGWSLEFLVLLQFETPAMEAGLASHVWSLEELIALTNNAALDAA
jgi:hypothetical protein